VFKESVKSFGNLLLGIAIFIFLIFISYLIFVGSLKASEVLLPLFAKVSVILFLLNIFVFLPLAISRKIRPMAATAIFISSYIFGATLWMEGFLLTLAIWGIGAIIIGFLIVGIGVVPIAILATLIKGLWPQFIELVLLTILTFSCRLGALKLLEGDRIT